MPLLLRWCLYFWQWTQLTQNTWYLTSAIVPIFNADNLLIYVRVYPVLMHSMTRQTCCWPTFFVSSISIISLRVISTRSVCDCLPLWNFGVPLWIRRSCYIWCLCAGLKPYLWLRQMSCFLRPRFRNCPIRSSFLYSNARQ